MIIINSNKIKKLLVIILTLAGLLFTIAVIIIIYTYITFNPNNLFFISNENAEINSEAIKFKKVNLENISNYCIDAVISTEDKSFNQNIGIDFNGTVRSILGIILNKDFGGGSTISQQVIKISSQNVHNRTSIDKLTEIIYAIKLNQYWSKEKILETYINNAYFGGFNYGIEAASKNFFGKNVNQLNLSECAYLAGLPQLPEVYNPFKNLKLGLQRRDIVLELMFSNKKITEAQKIEAENKKLVFNLADK